MWVLHQFVLQFLMSDVYLYTFSFRVLVLLKLVIKMERIFFEQRKITKSLISLTPELGRTENRMGNECRMPCDLVKLSNFGVNHFDVISF